MPLTAQDGALLGGGMWLAAAATFFYKKKQTLPFKVAYFLAWPTLGTAVILVAMPSKERTIADLKKSGLATDESISEAQKMRQLQIESLRQAAIDSKPSSRTDG